MDTSQGLVFNTALLRERVPSIADAARRLSVRPATISDLCTGKTPVGEAKVKTLKALADLAGCPIDALIVHVPARESFGDTIRRWNASGDGHQAVGGPHVHDPVPLDRSVAALRALPRTGGEDRPAGASLTGDYAI